MAIKSIRCQLGIHSRESHYIPPANRFELPMTKYSVMYCCKRCGKEWQGERDGS